MIHNRLSKTLLMLVTAGAYLPCAAQNFNFKNKSGDSVEIKLMKGRDALTTGLQRVANGADYEFSFNTNQKPTAVEIYPRPASPTDLPDKIVAEFKSGKYSIIHIKFDGQKVVPQIGGRLSGKTTSGASTKDNIEKGNIIVAAAIKGSAAKEFKPKGGAIVTGSKESVQENIAKNKPAKSESTKSASPIEKSTQKGLDETTSKSIDEAAEKMRLAEEEAWARFPQANALRKQGADFSSTNKNKVKLAELVLDLDISDLDEATLENARSREVQQANKTSGNLKFYILDIIKKAHERLSVELYKKQ